MKILLIKPLLNSDCDLLLEPPLGLLYISAFLKSHGYQDIKVIHMDAPRLDLEGLRAFVLDYGPDLVGLSTSLSEAKGMHNVAALMKEIVPKVVVVAGGPHPTADPEDVLKDGFVDVAVIGEGEEPFLEIVKHLGDTKAYSNIAGIAFRSNGGMIKTQKSEPIADLDALPYPDWGAIDASVYRNFLRMCRAVYGFVSMPIFTSRGCPFYCTYCHNIFGKKFRAHSAARVLEEIQILYDHFGIRHFEIVDDIFNFDRKRIIDIMQGIISRKLDIRLYFPNGLRFDMLDEEVIELLAKAGTVFISVAVETASQRLQKRIKKNVNLQKVKKLIIFAAKKGIYLNGFFMIGFPDETWQEMMQTIRYAVSSRLHSVYFFFVHPFKGTVLGEEIEKSGKKTASYQNTINYIMLTHRSLTCSLLSVAQLRFVFYIAILLFYGTPSRLFRIIRDFPSKKVIMRIFYDAIKRLVFNTRIS